MSRCLTAWAGVGALCAGALAGAKAPPLTCCPTDSATFSTSSVTPIPDQGMVSVVITVSGMGAYLWDVDLTTFLPHQFSSDLVMVLRSPAGSFVTISNHRGSSAANVFNGTLWDDSAVGLGAASLVTEAFFLNNVVAGPLAPEEPLGDFIGQNPNGAWQLTISDTSQFATGVLNAASLTITTCDAPPSVISGTYSTNTPRSILDQSTVTSTIGVSGARGAITHITAQTFLRHTANGQLMIRLKSPRGTVVPLSDANGGTLDNIFNGTVWRDDAGFVNPPGAITENALINNVVESPLCPQGAMAAFNGEDPNGTWTLSITDTAPGDTGTLDSWSITIDACGSPRCESDITGDGVVNSSDLGRLLGGWGPCP